MHPAFKTSYFREQGWPEEWIETATGIAREIWQKQYKKTVPANCEEPVSKKPHNALYDKHFKKGRELDDFKCYIASAPSAEIRDPLAYW
ncbi:hypothetical protein MPER_00100, partial [Moniliophthora perniciosa FA553]